MDRTEQHPNWSWKRGNHRGSLFRVPELKPVLNSRFETLKEIERNPDKWYRTTRVQRELKAVEMLAEKIGSSSTQDLVFVDNTTTGINVVLKSLKLSTDDIIIATSHTYGSTRKAATEATNRADADIWTRF